MYKLILKSTVFFLTLFFPILLNAQEEKETDILDMSLTELMEMSISVGSKTAKNADESPGAITIISKDQIRKLNIRTLRDALNVLVPGFDVVPTYFKQGNNVNEGIYVRGILSDFNQQVLILYNNENKFNESTFGSPYTIMEQTLENVERIEINSSPSPLLGGGALTTINIVSREQFLEGVEAFTTISGSASDALQAQKISINWGKTFDSWHLAGALQAYTDKGQPHPDVQTLDSTITGSNFLRDQTDHAVNTSINIKSPNDKVEISSMYRSITKDAYLSGLTISQSNDIYKYNVNTWHNFVKYKPIKNLDISLGYSHFDFNNFFNLFELLPFGVNQSQNVPFGINIKNYSAYVQANYLKEFSFMGQHISWIGVKAEQEGQSSHNAYMLQGTSFEDVTIERENSLGISLPNKSRNVYSIFAEDNWKLVGKLSALVGFRYDYYTNYNGKTISAFNPRLALSYLPSKNLIIKALYSSAVRPPSIYELQGSKFLPFLYGNNDVTFENLKSYELSFIYKTEKIKMKITPFVEQFNNRIEYVASTIDTTIQVAGNSGKTEVYGVEASVQYNFTRMDYLFLNGSKFVSEDKSNNLPTFFIPDLYVNGGFNYYLTRKISLNSTFYYRGKRQLPDDLVKNINKASVSQFNLNSSLNYNTSSKMRFYLLVENMLGNVNNVPLSKDGLYVPLRGRTFNVGLMINY